MWIEKKSDTSGLFGPARIGRVTYSKSGKSLKYNGLTFYPLKGRGFKSNYEEYETGNEYWISDCRKDGKDALYNTDVEIDDDVLKEYWVAIRNQPENIKVKKFRAQGKY